MELSCESRFKIAGAGIVRVALTDDIRLPFEQEKRNVSSKLEASTGRVSPRQARRKALSDVAWPAARPFGRFAERPRCQRLTGDMRVSNFFEMPEIEMQMELARASRLSTYNPEGVSRPQRIVKPA